MSTFFLILMFLSLGLLIAGLLQPSLFKNKKTGLPYTRGQLTLVFSLLVIFFFVLFGIVTPTPEKKPEEKINSKVLDQKEAIAENKENDNKGPLSQAKSYVIVGKEDVSIPGRKRMGIIVISREAKTYDELAQTAMKAAMDYQKETEADLSYVWLEMSAQTQGAGYQLAIADYAPDGKGNSDIAVPFKWQVEAVKDMPSEQTIKIMELWQSNKKRFQKNGLTDEQALKKFIAGKLKIKVSAVTTYYAGREKYEVRL